MWSHPFEVRHVSWGALLSSVCVMAAWRLSELAIQCVRGTTRGTLRVPHGQALATLARKACFPGRVAPNLLGLMERLHRRLGRLGFKRSVEPFFFLSLWRVVSVRHLHLCREGTLTLLIYSPLILRSLI